MRIFKKYLFPFISLSLKIFIIFFLFNISFTQAQTFRFWNTSNSSIPTDNLSCLKIDNDGIIWIGSYFSGLIKFDGVNFSNFNTSNSPLKADWVNSIAMDKFNNLWLATLKPSSQGALMKFDGINNWLHYDTLNSGISNGNNTSVAVDTNNVVWCYFFKLSKFDGSNWTIYDSTNSLLKDGAGQEIYVDKKNNKWIGTDVYGLFKLENDLVWTHYDRNNSGMGSGQVNKIKEDNAGNLWMTLSYGGLTKFNTINNIWTNWTPKNSKLNSAHYWGLCIDKNNYKWLGSVIGDSLLKFNDTTFTFFNSFSLRITDIQQDRYGNLWMATQNGLLEFNPNGIVGINISTANIPAEYKINKIYPNPFNPATKISYSLKKSSNIELKLFDLSGRFVRLIQSGFKPAGSYEINFTSEGLSSGVYFISLYADGILADTKKAVILK